MDIHIYMTTLGCPLNYQQPKFSFRQVPFDLTKVSQRGHTYAKVPDGGVPLDQCGVHLCGVEEERLAIFSHYMDSMV